MGRKYDYQYLVIGSGAAGGAAALLAAEMGVKTALVEADAWGGTDLNYRDIPYGAALNFAHQYAEMLTGARFGISSNDLHYNYAAVLNWQAVATRRAGGGSKKVFESAKVDCIRGYAQFTGSNSLDVDGMEVRAEKILIATGSNLTVSGISGIDTISCWSPDTALRIPQIPEALLIVGAGSTGCELAQYFAALGSKVLLAEMKDRILPREDVEVSEVMDKYLRDRYQVKILTNARVIALDQDERSKQVIFVRDGQEKLVRVEEVVLATTPEPAIDLNLEKAGIKYSRTGIKVDKNLQTTNRDVWAAGDVIGGESSTERATYEGKLATMNALKKSGSILDYTGFTRMTNTLPQVAKVGLNETECWQLKQRYKTTVVPIETTHASITSDFRTGFVKLLAEPHKGRILGATIVSPEADLAIQEIALALRNGLRVGELAGTPHVAASWGEAVRIAARKLAK